MPWRKLLACATGQIDEALRRKHEFVLEENCVYRALLDRHSPHWRLQNSERKPPGKLLNEVITIVQPETLLKWHRRGIASKSACSVPMEDRSCRSQNAEADIVTIRVLMSRTLSVTSTVGVGAPAFSGAQDSVDNIGFTFLRILIEGR